MHVRVLRFAALIMPLLLSVVTAAVAQTVDDIPKMRQELWAKVGDDVNR